MLKVKIFSGSMRAATALLAVAAEALGVPAAAIDLRIGDSALPPAMIAGGSMGTASWTWAVIRWISYDRPGYLASTSRPGRDVASAAADSASVADALGVAEFAVMGHSGGGPHALACAALLPGGSPGLSPRRRRHGLGPGELREPADEAVSSLRCAAGTAG